MQNSNRNVIRKSFSRAAAPPAQYVFDYAAEVADFYAAFPQLADKVIFIETSARRLICPDATRVAKLGTALKRPGSGLGHYITRSRDIGACTAVRTNFVEDGCYILVNTEKERDNLPRRFGYRATRDIELSFKLDHEIGHQVCKNGWQLDDINLGECAADAYAVLRHIQRFGGVTPHLAHLPAFRAVELVFRPDDGVHFTSPVVARILSDSKKKDYAALTPVETVKLADAYAAARPVDGQAISRAAAEFGDFKGRFTDLLTGDMSVLRQLDASLAQDHSSLALTWGAAALKVIVEGEAQCQGQRILPKGPEWKARLQKLRA